MKNEKTIALSIVKAAVYAVLLPVVIATLTAIIKDAPTAFWLLASYYLAFSIGYRFANSKQLTAYYFFNILKYLILPFAVGYVGLIFLGLVISHVY